MLPFCSVSIVPDIITIVRMICAPYIFYYERTGQHKICLILFMIACWTDWLDGFSARFLKCESKLGACLDPIADKILAFFVYLMMYPDMPYLFWIIITRDVCIMLGSGIALAWKLNIEMKPLWVSKINTTFLLILPFVWLLQRVWMWNAGEYFLWGIKSLILITTVLSSYGYAKIFGKAVCHRVHESSC